ncbi:MAG: hypothetical protein J0L87_15435 [Bacteroidetes bacterium]|nr:hypothetical protein [Bacteroidota bacterium]
MKMPKRLTIQEMNDYRDRMKNTKNNQSQENKSTNREKKSTVFEKIGQSKVVRIIKNGILIVVSLFVGAELNPRPQGYEP